MFNEIYTVFNLTEYEYVTHYDIHVSTPRGLRNSDHCPEYTSRHFVAPKVCTYVIMLQYSCIGNVPPNMGVQLMQDIMLVD